ncbi:MAG: SPFH domain-containing protein [Anaerolineales bacterium]|nr:SPFH domain-containing protein [Anaerolineales bacterium]MDW8278671.1 SPFH domain-containing protein [Anaerolineales bacterium]
MNQIPDQEGEENLDLNLVKKLTEFWGRRQQLLPPQFGENEIVSGPYPLEVNLLGAGYVPSFPNLEAIVVSADGERLLAQGGYIKLPPGRYKIYYVDRQERYMTLPDVRATTTDGANVTISCGITFTVNDALAVQKIRNPLDALVKACEAALRHIIRTHRHDELIGETQEEVLDLPVPTMISNEQISEAVKREVSVSEACRPFTLHNVHVLDRQGHLRLLDVREQEAVQMRTGKRELKQIEQRAQITQKQRLLTAEQGSVTQQQAENEKTRREILLAAEKLAVELEQMRQLPRFSHQENLKIIEARIEALKTLMNAQALPGNPRSIEELKQLVEKILSEMPHITGEIESPPVNEPKQPGARETQDEFIELLIPKKKR